MVTKDEVTKMLRKAGFKKTQGGNHEIWQKQGFPQIPIPRHKGDLKKGTVNRILKLAGLK